MNTKQMVFLSYLLFFFINIQSILGWRGNAVPVAFNTQTQEWSVLFRFENNGWRDFFLSANPGERGNIVAQRALREQTARQYDIVMQGVPWIKSPTTNDIIHFVPVPYISGKELYQKARNQWAEDFAWIPVTELLTNEKVQRPHDKRPYFVDADIHAIIKQYWPTILPQLTGAPQTTQPTQPVSGKKNWFNIPGAIYFYDKKDSYYEFTNFAEGYPITINGKIWPTSEQYYQAQKFIDPDLQETIRNFKIAREAFDFVRKPEIKAKVRADWKNISLDEMYKVVKAKFTQHPNLKQMLLDTDNKILVENAGANDAFFGAGIDGYGENYLGRMLMQVREELWRNIMPAIGLEEIDDLMQQLQQLLSKLNKLQQKLSQGV